MTPCLRVKLFAFCEHFDKLFDAFGTGFGFFGGLDAPEEGVAVGAEIKMVRCGV